MAIIKWRSCLLLLLVLATYSAVVSMQKQPDNKQMVAVESQSDGDDEVEVVNVGDEDLEQSDVPVFVATHEWQKILPGQGVPKGLHIRINLETGYKEAKLLGDNEEPSGNSQLTNDEVNAVVTDVIKDKINPKLLKDNLKVALKKIKSEDGKSAKELEEEMKLRKHKFRSYKEIKAELDELKINVETDSEIMDSLLNDLSLVDEDDSETKVVILQELEYLLHQIDNGVRFVDIGGLHSVVERGLNSTIPEVQVEVLKLLGSASQNNAKVQIKVIEGGLLRKISHIMQTSYDVNVRSRCIFALSSIVRGFPHGQQLFAEIDGFRILRKMLDERDWKMMPLHIKIISFIEDLLKERIDAKGNKAKQLKKVNLEKQLDKDDWCTAFATLLSSITKQVSAAMPDHDSVDKVISVMSAMQTSCVVEFSPYIMSLKALSDKYMVLAEEDGELEKHVDGGFFYGLAFKIGDLILFIQHREEYHQHLYNRDEL